MGYKIREAQLEKIPIMLILGENTDLQRNSRKKVTAGALFHTKIG
ncbi:hypothetical protein EXW96_03620 [Paenibacillus sp. JMULE4]|nr:hypothetical protein [Paenibacillus sp. JMULE4]